MHSQCPINNNIDNHQEKDKDASISNNIDNHGEKARKDIFKDNLSMSRCVLVHFLDSETWQVTRILCLCVFLL